MSVIMILTNWNWNIKASRDLWPESPTSWPTLYANTNLPQSSASDPLRRRPRTRGCPGGFWRRWAWSRPSRPGSDSRRVRHRRFKINCIFLLNYGQTCFNDHIYNDLYNEQNFFIFLVRNGYWLLWSWKSLESKVLNIFSTKKLKIWVLNLISIGRSRS